MSERICTLAIVPARGGSKGIPRKNLQKLAGISLVGRVAQLITEVAQIDFAVLSSDCDEIIAEANAFGLAAPFRRPAELAGDRVGDLPVLQHALQAAEEHFSRRFSHVLMLQPTCPLRTAKHVQDCLQLALASGAPAVWTVSPVELKDHPWKQLKLMGDHLAYFSAEGASIIARQQLEVTYRRNGACYVWRREVIEGAQAMLPPGSRALVLNDPLYSIDSLDDLEVCAEALAKRGSGA